MSKILLDTSGVKEKAAPQMDNLGLIGKRAPTSRARLQFPQRDSPPLDKADVLRVTIRSRSGLYELFHELPGGTT